MGASGGRGRFTLIRWLDDGREGSPAAEGPPQEAPELARFQEIVEELIRATDGAREDVLAALDEMLATPLMSPEREQAEQRLERARLEYLKVKFPK